MDEIVTENLLSVCSEKGNIITVMSDIYALQHLKIIKEFPMYSE
jgi:hypothetical protein